MTNFIAVRTSPPRHRGPDAAVRRYLDGRDIEIAAGDVADTWQRLGKEDLVLTFIDRQGIGR